jgi:hypothetical protein
MSRLMKSVTVSVSCASLFFALGATAEVYRYADEQGKMHIVDRLDKVPAQYREAADRDARERSGGSINIVGESSEAPSMPAAPERTQAASPESGSIGGHDQSWWRSQARQMQENVVELNNQLEGVREDEANWSDQIYARPNARGPRASAGGKPGAGPGHNRARARRAAALSGDDDTDEPSVEELETAVAEAERKLERLHDDARRAGVPPGWLR